jgi:hypothetical protein
VFESVTVDQLARMLPGASRVSLVAVLELVHSEAGSRELAEIVDSCECLAGSLFCTCVAGASAGTRGENPVLPSGGGTGPLSEKLAAVYGSKGPG